MTKTSDEFRKQLSQKESDLEKSESPNFSNSKDTKKAKKTIPCVNIETDYVTTQDGAFFDKQTKEMIPPMAYDEQGFEISFLHPTPEQIQSSVMYQDMQDVFLTNPYYAKFNLCNRKNWLRVLISFNREQGGAPVEVSTIQIVVPYLSDRDDICFETFDFRIASSKRDAIPIVLPMFIVAELVRKGYKAVYGSKQQDVIAYSSNRILNSNSVVYENALKTKVNEARSHIMVHEGKSKCSSDRPFYSIFMCSPDDPRTGRELSPSDFLLYDGHPLRTLTQEEILDLRKAKLSSQKRLIV